MNDERNIAVIANDISYIKRDVAEIKTKLDDDYVTRAEFEPIKKVVYGLISVLGLATIGAILKLIIR